MFANCAIAFYYLIFFFFNDTATTEIYTLSLHDALPISAVPGPTASFSAWSYPGPRSGAAMPIAGRWRRAAVAMREAQPGRAEPADEVPVRIVLVDDHAILRQGLRSLLEREHDLQVVGEASSAGEALAVVERTRPTIVVLDMKLSPASDNDGLGLCARLTKRYPGLSVLVLSTFVDDALVVSAIEHGASGYVVKDVDTVELVRSIRLVARNGSAFDSRSAAAMVRSIHAPQARSPLTDRELNVLRLVANGLSNRGIGAHLHLSETTVKFHVRNIMRKLDATSRAEAVYKAAKNGLDLTSS